MKQKSTSLERTAYHEAGHALPGTSDRSASAPPYVERQAELKAEP